MCDWTQESVQHSETWVLVTLLYPGQTNFHIVWVLNRVWPLNSRSNSEESLLTITSCSTHSCSICIMAGRKTARGNSKLSNYLRTHVILLGASPKPSQLEESVVLKLEQWESCKKSSNCKSLKTRKLFVKMWPPEVTRKPHKWYLNHRAA